MSIQFRCNVCQQRLGVPVDSAGKQARCPNCSTVVQVPDETANVSSSTTPSQTISNQQGDNRGPDGHNPYAAPSFSPDFLPTGTIDAGYALSSAWGIFKVHAGVLIAAYVIQMAFSFGISFGTGFLQTIVENVIGDPGSPIVLLIGFCSWLLNQLIQVWLTIGFLRITLAAARNQPTEIGMLFSGGPYLLRYMGAGIIFSIAMTIGFLLLIVPGVYILVTYWSYMYFIVDRNCGVFDSFQLAGMHASGNRLNVILIGMISIGLSILGLMACGVGIFVTAPLVVVMITVAYLMITRQSFAQPT